jgi:hypothetical protein
MNDALHLAPRRSERPSVDVSDLILPRPDGREVREVEQLSRIRVMVWSSSLVRKDVGDLRTSQDVIGTVERSRLRAACLPNNNNTTHHP